MKKIADYIIDLMRQDENEWISKDGNICIIEHSLLNSAYIEWSKEQGKTMLSHPYNRIKAAWKAVTRDERFEKTNSGIKCVLFSNREHWHRIYKLKGE